MGTSEYMYLAQAYGSGNYGDCGYNTSTTCSGATTGGSTPLVNTGLAIAAIVTLACFILFIAVLVRWWRRPRKAADLNK